MVFPNNNYNIMNHNRNMYFYDEGGGEKPNPDPVIYQWDEFQFIDTLSLNPVDEFNPNLSFYILEYKCNNNHKYDRVKYLLKEDDKFMV